MPFLRLRVTTCVLTRRTREIMQPKYSSSCCSTSLVILQLPLKTSRRLQVPFCTTLVLSVDIPLRCSSRVERQWPASIVKVFFPRFVMRVGSCMTVTSAALRVIKILVCLRAFRCTRWTRSCHTHRFPIGRIPWKRLLNHSPQGPMIESHWL